MRVALVGDPGLLALHGVDGSFGSTHVRDFAQGDAEALAAFAPDVVISLGSESLTASPGRHLVWRLESSDAHAASPTVSAGGSGLWRRAPLPAGDALFGSAPQGNRRVLVVGADRPSRDEIVAALGEEAIQARACDAPSPDDLASANTVAVLGSPGEPMPALAIAAMARGRVVLAPQSAPSFGLNPGVDHLAYGHEHELVRLARAAAAWPSAFTTLAAMGRLAAEAHRASTVYARMAVDLLAA